MLLLLRSALTALWLLMCLSPTASGAQEAVLLQADTANVAVWPWVTVLPEEGEPISIQTVMASTAQFQKPTSAYQTLGIARPPLEDQPVQFYWLHIPLRTHLSVQTPFVLHVGFPVLNLLDLYVVHQGDVEQRFLQGNLMPFSERPIAVATHAFNINLEPNSDYDIYLRVGSSGTFILPISIEKPAYFQRMQQNELLLQGVINGLCLALLVFSVGKWVLLRDSLYFKYVLLICGMEMFFLVFHGLGSQYVWDGNAWLEIHLGLIGSMVAATGSLLFSEHLLRPPQGRPHWGLSLFMLGCVVFTALLCLLYGLNIINTATGTKIASAYALIPVLVATPLAWRRWRRDGERLGLVFLANLAFYTATAVIMAQIVHGKLDANFWTLHSMQIGSLVDILVFMFMLGMRSKMSHSQLQLIEKDQQLQDSTLLTDLHTGLMLRSGFMQRLEVTLAQSHHRFLTAVYIINPELIDSSNDADWLAVQHDVLSAIGMRLKSQLRGSDTVCRWGENSFAVMAIQLRNPEQALDIGNKLLHLVVEPLQLGHYEVYLGARIGYALAPVDAHLALDLMRMADIAVYTGTQHINQIQRYAASAAA
ncbi:diguanylate cyclase [Curvibacter sp. CHRR-16]|uniref:7TMR-DISM family protein n=1 Tax=Curvibacter sp. CHRR-16 TaxID=2835872 RepID=UPI001BDA1857|nr:7TM diverse intracellular signaling domain-containing protein [Curvibacter sp. CHRR-16]MBT0569757.1 diguanylate cyclase [Curvibacter sp. CHRR-16]